MKQYTIISILIILNLFLLSGYISAAMVGHQELEIDLTNVEKAKSKVTWSNEDKVNINNNGLGFDGAENSLVELSLQTISPFAIGYSWRPAQSAHITVEINPPNKTITLPNGQQSTPYCGNLFVRYSPDAKHWSSWQMLENQCSTDETTSIWGYKGQIAVPQEGRKTYQDYLYKFYKMDVPWSSDEEAAVIWILKKDPDFFKQEIPFIGYLKFLLETNIYGKQRIKNIKISVSYGVSGLHYPPKDKNVYKERDIPWRFKAN